MPGTDILRLTGVLSEFERDKPWRTRDNTRSGTMSVGTVRTSDWTGTEVTFADDQVDRCEKLKGQAVDFMVEVSASGGFTRIRVVNDWPTTTAAGGGHRLSSAS